MQPYILPGLFLFSLALLICCTIAMRNLLPTFFPVFSFGFLLGGVLGELVFEFFEARQTVESGLTYLVVVTATA